MSIPVEKNSALEEMADKVLDESQEGFEKLADEKLAEERRNETIVSKIIRETRRKLGLRKTKARTIHLN